MRKWNVIDLKPVLESKVPTCSGVYVIKQVRRVMGLPTELKIIYVGKSNNLRRRFKEHGNPHSEHNKDLFTFIWNEELEFWFTEVENDKLNEVEQELIRKLDPKTNVLRYGSD